MKREKIVVFTGAGISAESGLNTFRDSDGLWEHYPVEQVASIQGWLANPALVLDFYNHRRAQAARATPDDAHLAIAQLETVFDVVVVTQNVDDLHERAGSTKVLHLHGELRKVRSSQDSSLIDDIGAQAIVLGDLCKHGSQLRPHIVWFGEIPFYLDEAAGHLAEADYVLAVGSSLTVEPAASLLDLSCPSAEKVLISKEVQRIPADFSVVLGSASVHVPQQCRAWMAAATKV